MLLELQESHIVPQLLHRPHAVGERAYLRTRGHACVGTDTLNPETPASQVMSITETQYSNANVIIISPDSDNLSVLQVPDKAP